MDNTRNKLQNNILLIIIAILFIVSILPILIISFYNHPSLDDYNYSVYTMNIINTQGIFGIFKGILKTIKLFYLTWQGTYSAIVFMSLQPSIWGHEFYFISTWILLFTLIISTIIFMKIIVVNLLKLSKKTAILCAFLLLLITIQTMPSLVQGVFWWNGSSYYTLFYSFLLIEISLIIKYLNSGKKFLLFIIGFLIFIIAGGNYITALQQSILLFVFYLINRYLRKKNGFIILFLISIFGLILSGVAPGNAVRSAGVQGMPAINAILVSFKESFLHIIEWSSIENILFSIIIVLLLYKSYKNLKFKFKHPIIILLFSYCIFSALFTPTLYATSGLGEGRLTNIIYYNYFWFLIFNLYYIIGFFRNIIISKKVFNEDKFLNLLKECKGNIIFSFIVLIFILVLIVYPKSSFNITLTSLENGEAKIYDKEYKERIRLLEDDSLKDITFKPFSVYPEVLFVSEIGSDPNDWRNVPMTEIYKKNTVKIEE